MECLDQSDASVESVRLEAGKLTRTDSLTPDLSGGVGGGGGRRGIKVVKVTTGMTVEGSDDEDRMMKNGLVR